MQQIAEDVWQLIGWPRDFLNVYLIGDVLIDSGTRWAKWRIRRQLGRRVIRLIALTHVHPDHQGSARALCEEYEVPLACHEADVPYMEGRAPMLPRNRLLELGARFLAGPPVPVGRVLRDGDEVAGFRVVHTPGHTPGHVVYFRAADRVAIAGDLGRNGFVPWQYGRPSEPPAFFSVDPALNHRSLRRLLELRPRLVCFGHGPPLTDPGALEKLVASEPM